MFAIDDAGWLAEAAHCATENHSERPDGAVVDLLVIHNISLPPGQFGGGFVQQLFTNCLDCDAHPAFDELRELRVSAHLLIERTGRIIQFVPFAKRAWHAGISEFAGRENCNDFSIGIELEGCDALAYTDAQYDMLAAVTEVLQARYPAMTSDRIVGHSDIAPLRKTDPGPAFDWLRLRAARRVSC